MILRTLIVAGLVLVLGAVGFETWRKERLLVDRQALLLELVPRDPRSLIQGDYMQLEYAIARRAARGADWPRDGALVVSPDEDGVAQFRRRDTGEPLGLGEARITYRIRGGRLQIGTNAYYFQEGQAAAYAAARYGEVRVGPDGTTLLTGLRDVNLSPLPAVALDAVAPGR